MAQHFPTLSSFRARSASQTFSISSNEEDKWMLAKLLIKTGDIGHSMLAWDQHYVWACRVNEEFFKQVSVRRIYKHEGQRLKSKAAVGYRAFSLPCAWELLRVAAETGAPRQTSSNMCLTLLRGLCRATWRRDWELQYPPYATAGRQPNCRLLSVVFWNILSCRSRVKSDPVWRVR